MIMCLAVTHYILLFSFLFALVVILGNFEFIPFRKWVSVAEPPLGTACTLVLLLQSFSDSIWPCADTHTPLLEVFPPTMFNGVKDRSEILSHLGGER